MARAESRAVWIGTTGIWKAAPTFVIARAALLRPTPAPDTHHEVDIQASLRTEVVEVV